ncbi:PHB depolymerase family esterase [Actinoplanes sp. NBRC 103695]|uniref:alpha/beta hydrolase family esterase n=1 Tax=Actinoplanes sp. NBRC 103695 TaxID=3032202 RepID=UPI0024A30F7C|nr:PHB depolymerase family esterase [Actinoplanes sp. NBRC 103695]GLY93216.1 polyhydroxybutyrate depolymerase [Actinoplanes sp. NBRC 103695]
MSDRPVRRAALVIAAAAALVSGAAAPASAAASASCSRPPGDATVDVRFQGQTYPVLVHIPPALPGAGRVPLVLNLHGSSGNGPGQMDYTGLRAVADENGFIVAAPNGAISLPQNPMPADGSWAWNVPGVPTTAGQMPPPDARDDVRFLGKVIDVLAERLCTDPRRTYATGNSGGARMSSALACRLSGKIAAIAAGAGLRAGRPDPDDVTVPEAEDCRPGRPVPVVTWHGQQDTVNPYPGSADLRWGYAVPLAAQTWARLNGCRSGPRAETVTEHVTRLTYTGCRRGADVVLYRISNGGHVWPGVNEPGSEIDASRILWDFFERFRLPAA